MCSANPRTEPGSLSLIGVSTTRTFGGRVGISLGGVLGQI
jgi:hypothetical protein